MKSSALYLVNNITQALAGRRDVCLTIDGCPVRRFGCMRNGRLCALCASCLTCNSSSTSRASSSLLIISGKDGRMLLATSANRALVICVMRNWIFLLYDYPGLSVGLGLPRSTPARQFALYKDTPNTSSLKRYCFSRYAAQASCKPKCVIVPERSSCNAQYQNKSNCTIPSLRALNSARHLAAVARASRSSLPTARNFALPVLPAPVRFSSACSQQPRN